MAQFDLKLLVLYLSLPSVSITGVFHHTQPIMYFLQFKVVLKLSDYTMISSDANILGIE